MFQQYEAELQEVLADAEARLGALLGATDTADRSGAVRQLNDLVRTARDLEKQIDVEVRSAAPDARAALRERARPLGDRLAALRRQAEAVAEEADRERVLGVRAQVRRERDLPRRRGPRRPRQLAAAVRGRPPRHLARGAHGHRPLRRRSTDRQTDRQPQSTGDTLMPFELWLAFVAASAVLLVIPGPTILTVISYSMSHGRRANARAPARQREDEVEDLFGQVGGGVAAPGVVAVAVRRYNSSRRCAIVFRRVLEDAARGRRRDLLGRCRLPHAVCDVARRHLVF